MPADCAFPTYPFDAQKMTDWAMDEYHFAADPTDFVLLGKLQAELDARAADKEALEDEWLEVADALGET